MEYILLTELYEKLESTSKRLEKTRILSEFLKNCPAKEVDRIMLLVQGLVFTKNDDRKIGIASKLVIKSLNIATGISVEDIEKSWKKTGDLGISSEELIKKKKQHTLFSEKLTIAKVFNNIQKLSSIEGIGSTDVKLKTIAELLTSAEPKEAKYIVRTVLEDLRVGLGEGTLRDAIAWAVYEKNGGEINLTNEKEYTFGGINPEINKKLNEDTNQNISEIIHIIPKTEELNSIKKDSNNITFEKGSLLYTIRNRIQEIQDVTNDFALTAIRVLQNDFKIPKLDANRPVKVMLAQKAKTIAEAFEMVGKPAAIEYKYDGFRMLIGKQGDKITIHTRRLENVTTQFPEVEKLIRENITTESCIIDGEAVGYDPITKKYVPFQNISQRIRRKYDIEKMAKDVPVELNIFDILYYEGNSTIKESFANRRKIIEKIIIEKPLHIRLAKQITTDEDVKAEEFYHQSLNAGNEGVMFKSLDSPYKPGSRVGNMVKLKPVMETLDLVIVAAEWGEGKRAGWLTSYTVAAYDEDTNEYLEIGKFGTGIKEKKEEDEKDNENIVSFEELTENLKPNIITEKGREVRIKPNIVVELKFEEIQKSPSYSSGYALRFPRLVRIRLDRSPDEISTIEQIEGFYKEQ
ncbi:MAG: ATP-dependent DNA ligase [Candidatus Woesearchaeota archaeon]